MRQTSDLAEMNIIALGTCRAMVRAPRTRTERSKLYRDDVTGGVLMCHNFKFVLIYELNDES